MVAGSKGRYPTWPIGSVSLGLGSLEADSLASALAEALAEVVADALASADPLSSDPPDPPSAAAE